MKHKDKLLHFAVNFIIISLGIIAGKALNNKWVFGTALVLPIVLSVAKEIHDWHKFKKNNPVYDAEKYANKRDDIAWDLFADFWGYTTGGVVGGIICILIWHLY